MKKIITCSILFCLLSCMLFADTASERRTFIRSKLGFYYVPNPNTDTAGIRLAISANESDPRDVFNGNAKMDPLKKFLVSLLNDGAHGGNENIQIAFKDILSIRGVNIAMYMYNDEVPFNNNATSRFISCTDAAGYQWPCANRASSGGFNGFIHIGQHFFSTQSLANAHFVVLHELVHTQDLSNFDLHSFIINGQSYRYGADGGHSLYEAIPSMGNAFKEGIANALAAQYAYGQTYLGMDALFTPETIISVEMTTPTPNPTPGANPDIWLYQQLQTLKINPIRTSGAMAYYKLKQLPPRIILHNELTTANIMYHFMEYINVGRVITAFKEYNRGNGSVFSGNGTLESMITTLCQISLPESFRAQSFPNCSDYPERKEHLLPIAFADYYTNYSANSEPEFIALFDNGMNVDLLHCYWALRPSVLSAIRSERSISRVKTAIAIALGINSSQLEDR